MIENIQPTGQLLLPRGSVEGGSAIGPNQAREEQDRLRDVLTIIGQRSVELTQDPQSDIDPASLFEWKKGLNGELDDEAIWNQIYEPQLPAGVTIDRAVRVARSDLGHTSFVVLHDDDGSIAAVERNEGRTAYAGEARVGEKHQEISVTILRKSRLSNDITESATQHLYHLDHITIGNTPGTTVLDSSQFIDEETYDNYRENFPYSFTLTSTLAVSEKCTRVEPNADNYEAVLHVLEQGQIAPKDMARAIARRAQLGSVLPECEYQKSLAAYGRNFRLWEEQQSKRTEVIIVDSLPTN